MNRVRILKIATVAIAFSILVLAVPNAKVDGQQRNNGIVGQQAPAWSVSQWLNLPDGKRALDISDYEGKVLYLYCFQSWCPGCHRHGFPTLQQLMEHYDGNEDVAFVALQTTFEGFDSNGFDDAKEVAKRYGLEIPVGQSGTASKSSAVMRDYRTGGTPWAILIDQRGVVRYNDFHVTPGAGVRMIDYLLDSPRTE